jgi:cytochrome c
MRAVLSFLLLVMTGLASASAADLHDAARSGDVSAITAALDGGADVNADDGGTALYIAARRGHVEAVQLLIERGADVNMYTKSGTALFAAVSRSKTEVIKLLLEKGADPNLQFAGDSVLHIASKVSCSACLKLLVEAGADVNALNIKAQTPLHLARRLGTPEMAEYLLARSVELPKPAAISGKLAAADVKNGEAIFVRHCSYCHLIQPNAVQRPGPPLWDIVGSDKASTAFKSYSAALHDAKGSWTYEELNIFLFAPMATMPGVGMNFTGLPNEADRANLIAYLRTLSDTPQPLP